MRWFNRWLARRVEAAMNDRKEVVLRSSSDIPEPRELQSSGIIFHLYPAAGGTVIETRQYDRKHDRNELHLYIIPEGDDFTNSLAEIVSMERIKSLH